MLLAATHCVGSIPTSPIHERLQKAHPSRSRSLKVLSGLDRTLSSTLESTPRVSVPGKDCDCFDLFKDLVPYGKAWSWQKSIVNEKKALIQNNEDCPDTLIVLQHDPVYTMGTSSSIEFLNFDMKDAPYEVYRTERGGEVTYHGPGQLVLYPIINLRNHKMDLHWYLRALEEVVICVLAKTFSIKASRLEGLTGVWETRNWQP